MCYKEIYYIEMSWYWCSHNEKKSFSIFYLLCSCQKRFTTWLIVSIVSWERMSCLPSFRCRWCPENKLKTAETKQRALLLSLQTKCIGTFFPRRKYASKLVKWLVTTFISLPILLFFFLFFFLWVCVMTTRSVKLRRSPLWIPLIFCWHPSHLPFNFRWERSNTSLFNMFITSDNSKHTN